MSYNVILAEDVIVGQALYQLADGTYGPTTGEQRPHGAAITSGKAGQMILIGTGIRGAVRLEAEEADGKILD